LITWISLPASVIDNISGTRHGVRGHEPFGVSAPGAVGLPTAAFNGQHERGALEARAVRRSRWSGDDDVPEDLPPREDNPLTQPTGDDVGNSNAWQRRGQGSGGIRRSSRDSGTSTRRLSAYVHADVRVPGGLFVPFLSCPSLTRISLPERRKGR
jgi:hypothetical protein